MGRSHRLAQPRAPGGSRALVSTTPSLLPTLAPWTLSLQEIMVGPQFQADLSNLHMSRHGEKCKWGWVVGEQREPHSCGERAWCHPARARPQTPWGGTEWGPGTGELGALTPLWAARVRAGD